MLKTETARDRRATDTQIRSDKEAEKEINLVRQVDERAVFIRQEYGAGETAAEVLAWRELGFSSSGIADMMDTTEGTVSSYLEDLREAVGGYVDKPCLPPEERDPERPIPGGNEL
jgi:DNA-directed RNA polymerase specialized sigma24 family protein